MRKFRFILFLFLMLNLVSCKVFYPNFMFRETRDFTYYELVEQKKEVEEKIIPGDQLTFTISSREGYRLIDVIGEGAGMGPVSGQGRLELNRFKVRENGYVELPIIGNLYVEGMTRQELEDLLEDRYSAYYNDPFILLNIVGRRVYVFMGLDGAKELGLPRENMTLIEVLALAGGITSRAKSHKIRIIRGDYDNPSIKKVDLSTIDGLKDADFIVQPDDLIIVDPVTKAAPALLREITPVLTLLTTLLTFYIVINRN